MRGNRSQIVALIMLLGLHANILSIGAADATYISFGAGNDVGASADTVWSVALGDLDNDGDLDIVSGSGPAEDYEIIAWQNDDTPFSLTWAANDVGANTTSIQSIAVGDLDNDGDLDIVSGDSDGIVIAWQNDGTPFSGTWTSNQAGDNTWGARVALGDLDNDGDLDIVTGNDVSEDFEVVVFENDGSPFSGTWLANDVGVSAGIVNSVALGDLDNDGDLDIVSGSGAAAEIIAWQNDGTPFAGTWLANDVSATIGNVFSVALGDLDNDGDLDIVSGSLWSEEYEVSAWQNDGTPFSGTWAKSGAGSSTETAQTVAVGDLDNDGDLDIVAGTDFGDTPEVIALQNDGTPFSDAWVQSVVRHSADMVWGVAIGDLDNDGDLDIVSGSGATEDYEVVASPNTLARDSLPLSFPANNVGASADSVYGVTAGDLDNDGDLDILSGSSNAEDYEIIAWQNDGSPFDSTWTQNDVGAASSSIYGVALGDLDNDGDLDAVSVGSSVADYEIIAWQNDGTPFSSTWTSNYVGTSYRTVWEVALGDLDNDGDLDMVVVRDYGGADEVIVFQNDGTPFIGAWVQNDVGDSPDDVNGVALGDLDNDGDLDIVSGSEMDEDYEIIAWQNDGSPFTGTWPFNDVGASEANVNSVAVGDLDNDGDLDVVSGGGIHEDYEVIAWSNDGSPFSGTWTQNDVGATNDRVASVVLGDLDNDGDLDIVSGTVGGVDSELIVWESDGTPFSGLWTEDSIGTCDDSIYSLTLGDLDNDGDLDVASGTSSGADYEVIVWQNGEYLHVYLPLILRD